MYFETEEVALMFRIYEDLTKSTRTHLLNLMEDHEYPLHLLTLIQHQDIHQVLKQLIRVTNFMHDNKADDQEYAALVRLEAHVYRQLRKRKRRLK